MGRQVRPAQRFTGVSVPLVALLLSAVASASAASPTFHRDILPILQKHCQECHRPGEIGRMPLLTYPQVRPWAKAIRQAVLQRTMPPWFEHGPHGVFSDDPRLTTEEITAIDEWVRAGSPAGSPADAPPPVRWPQGWRIGQPDRVVFSKPLSVPASGELDYQFVIIPLGQTKDVWITRAEIRPSARSVVHHIVAYIRPPGSHWLQGMPVGEAFSKPGVTTADILAVYTPGDNAMICPSGMAKKIPAGSDLILQYHFTPNGRARQERTEIGLIFTDQTPTRRVHTLQLATTTFLIPAGDSDYHVTVSGTMPADALLLSMLPHMHLRGKAFEYDLRTPAGAYRPVLRVEPYSFYWQLNYRLAEPIPLPKGTRLIATAWYDNSPNQAGNPDPSRDVGYGEQSRDEMMVGFFDIAVDPKLEKSDFFEMRGK